MKTTVLKTEVSKQVRRHNNQTKEELVLEERCASPEMKQIPTHTWRGFQTE